MDHPAWVDDERSPNCSTPIVRVDHPAPSRPLWKDVLWGRELGHDNLFKEWEPHRSCDISSYVDFEFDSGRGSPVETIPELDET